MKKLYYFVFILIFFGFVSYSYAVSEKNKIDIDLESKITKELKNWEVLNRNSTTDSSANEISRNLIEDMPTYAKGQVIVKYKENNINLNSNVGLEIRNSILGNKNLKVLEDNKKGNFSLVESKEGKNVNDLIMELSKDPNVEYVEPNYIYYIETIDGNDTYKTNLRGLDNTGQTINTDSSTADADMDWPEAMTIFTGNSSQAITGTVVAVIDTGVGYRHPDLENKMWDGTSCVDENGDALGDCIHGFDYGAVDTNPLPLASSHGTHIAGTIGAEYNNGKGLVGVNPSAKIMAVKSATGRSDVLYTSDIVKSIDFATQNGAKVINASYGSAGYSTAQYEAIARFRDEGGIFVTAAGNGNFDGGADYEGDEHGVELNVYPCDFDLDNIICTAATDTNDDLADFSDYGSGHVDVGAPGGTWAYGSAQIFSTEVDEKITLMTGGIQETSEGNLPSVFTQGGNPSDWGVKYTSEITIHNWLKAEYNSSPYTSSGSTYVISDELHVATGTDANVEFYVWCDTSTGTGDYANFFVTLDGTRYYGSNYYEDGLYGIYPELGILGGTGSYDYMSIDISAFTKDNMQIGFEWTTDLTGDNNHIGCAFSEVTLYGELDGSDEAYGWKNGTSMATPHVAGLASLAYSYRPDLSYDKIIEQIINQGDTISSLENKTVSGKRVNAYNTLVALTEPNGSMEIAEGESTTGTDITLLMTTDTPLTYTITGDLITEYTGSLYGTGGVSVVLSAGDGVKTVEVIYENPVGDTVSYEDSIILDSYVKGIDGGEYFTCMNESSNNASCWGGNRYGQIGDGTKKNRRKVPHSVNISNINEISSGFYHTCGLLNDGTIKCWGRNRKGQIGNGTRQDTINPLSVIGIDNAVSISAGGNHNCALLDDGTIKCWGGNRFGQIGDGSKKDRKKTPVLVNISNAKQVSCGAFHTCALLEDNTVKCWGKNDYGQLGNGTNNIKINPTSVEGLSNVKSIAVGDYHSCAVLNNNTMKCWGKGQNGQLGYGEDWNKNSPVDVANLSNVDYASLGGNHSCALLNDGTVKCWGGTYRGQVGYGGRHEQVEPISVSDLSDVIAIGTGGYHSCAILNNGIIKCWGLNDKGQLGDNTTTKRLTPVEVQNN